MLWYTFQQKNEIIEYQQRSVSLVLIFMLKIFKTLYTAVQNATEPNLENTVEQQRSISLVLIFMLKIFKTSYTAVLNATETNLENTVEQCFSTGVP